MKNTMYIEQCLSFDYIILAFTTQDNLSYITKKSPFAYKGDVLFDFKSSDFDWKESVFSFRIRERDYFSNMGTSIDVRFGWELRDRGRHTILWQ